MSQAPIMPFFTDAYLADTHHLGTETHGAYLLLLLYSWRCNGAPPPDDDRILSRITKLSLRRWQHTVRPQLEPFYTIDGGLWHQKRLQKTWNEVQQKIELQRQKGIKGNWIKKKKGNPLSRNESTSAVVPSQRTPSDKPSSINHEPVTTPALDALKPILHDVQYFVRDGKTLSPALTPQVHAAQKEAQYLLQPMEKDDAATQVARLWRMYPKREADSASLKEDYTQWFARYPRDMVIAACEYQLTHHPYPSLPRIADFAQHITPRYEQRRATLERVNRLAAQVGLAAMAVP